MDILGASDHRCDSSRLFTIAAIRDIAFEKNVTTDYTHRDGRDFKLWFRRHCCLHTGELIVGEDSSSKVMASSL